MFQKASLLADDMDSSSSHHSYSINLPKALPTPRQQFPETTPSKRNGSLLYHKRSSHAKIHSAPNILQVKESANESLGIPDQPIPYKRAKSATDQSPGAVISEDDRSNATVSPGSITPGSCNRKADHYQKVFWQSRHLSTCMDPICKVRFAFSQGTSPSNNTKSPSRIQEPQTEDVSITTPIKKPPAPPEPVSCDEARSGNKGSPSVLKYDLSAETFKTSREPPSGVIEFDEDEDQDPGDPCDAEPDQKESTWDENVDSTSPEVIRKMHDRLRKVFEKNVSLKDEPGHIYVFKDQRRPHLCKIGRSKEITIRRGAIERKCGLDLELVHHRKVSLYTRTEVLVQRYLGDLCEPWDCELCGETHSEWFNITSELAISAVDKWVNLMDRENPYHSSSGGLRFCWYERLSLHDSTFAAVDVNSLRMQWDKFISPSELDHFNFRFQPVWEKLWRFFWPVYATLAWTVTFIAYQHPVVFFLMATSVIGTFVSMSHDLHHLKHAPTISGKRRKR